MLATVAVSLALAALAATPSPPAPATPGSGSPAHTASEKAVRPNVVLAVVDTLRADHLSLYGYARRTSPELERWATSGVVFEMARSQAACTHASVASLLTGKYPFHFQPPLPGHFGIPAPHSTLAEILRAAGYRTIAISASPVIRKTPSRLNKVGGYDRGFDVFDESCEDAPARCVTARALELVDASPQPFFLYLHFLDPHSPYRPPPEHRWKLASPPDDEASGDLTAVAARLYHPDGGEAEILPGDVDRLRAAYDEEIRYWDESFSRLRGGLRARGLLARSVVVLTADHGEDFLEHGDLGHCRTVHDTSTHVPLILWGPPVAAAAGRRIPGPVENVDLLPTLLDLLDIDPPGTAFEGASARYLIDQESPRESYAFTAQGTMRAVNDHRHKLVYDLASQNVLLFDLEGDPGEQSDVSSSHPDVRRRLLRILLEHLAATEGEGSRWHAINVSRRVKQGLRELGYLE